MKIPIDDLASRLQHHGLARTYLITGDEPLQRLEAAESVRQAARARGINERVVFDADTGIDWGRFRQESESLSLFSTQRLLEVRFRAPKPGSAGERALCEYAGRPPSGDVLVVTSERLDARARGSNWVAALEQGGDTVTVEAPRYAQLPAWIVRRAAGRGLILEEAGAALLAERVEGNLLAASQEIELLSLLHGKASIGATEVVAVVADSARHSSFDVAVSALAGDAERTLRIVRGLRDEGAEVVPVTWVVIRDLRMLCGIEAVSDGVKAAHARARTTLTAERERAFRAALQRHRPAVLRGLLRYALRIDRACKGVSRNNPWDMLEWLLLRLAGVPVSGVLFDERMT